MATDAAAFAALHDSSTADTLWPIEDGSDGQPGWRPARPAMSPQPPVMDMSTYPGGEKSLAGISLRAFVIGVTLGVSVCLTIVVCPFTSLWRVPFFLASLSLFHFLEYYVTARYNTRYASVSAFLLTSNGWAYNAAHTSAVVECIVASCLFPDSYTTWTAPVYGVKVHVVVGVVLMVLGQMVRTVAMAQAGSNFNHTVQVEHKEGHRLVTSGVYRLFRHPSYFGFFWWGLGTQLVLGNVVCFAVYAVVLWRFFHSRIEREERFLVLFFGDEYRNYKQHTWVGIPGII